MIVKYNSLNRLEAPKLTLCNPGSVYNSGILTKTVGILTDHEAEEIVFNFNAVSELNFRVNKIVRENAEDNAHTYNLYKSVQNRRLVFVDDIGYFMISSVKDGFDGSVHYKDITAQSIDSEIQQKMIPYIEDGTYRFKTSGTEKGMLEKIVEVLPLWTIGTVDNAVASRYRTFNDVDVTLNCLGFMMDNMQDAYECIFVFDIINRIINVYDQANYVRQTDIHITKEDLINSIDITENADDLYTAISVMGDENVTISAINPLGTNVIYNFDYYLEWMSSGLKTKVIAWQNAVNAAKTQYYNKNLEYYTKLEEYNTLSLEKQKYLTQIKMYERCRDNIVAEAGTTLVSEYNKVIVENGGTAIEIYDELSETLLDIDAKILNCDNGCSEVVSQMSNLDQEISSIRDFIESIQEPLSITGYFTENEYAELSHYIYEGSYTDEYVTITDSMTYSEQFEQMKTLYDRAESRLERVSQPTQEFDIDVENFVFVKEFEHWSEQLETGCLINVELETDDIALLFLSNITINYDDHTLSMTFGNRFNKYDPRSLFDDVLGDITKSANTLNYIKEILYPIKNGEFDSVKEALDTARSLTMGAALASQGEEVVIDGSGYTGRKLRNDGTYEDEQVKLTGRNLVFTDDSWETCKVAIGKILFGDGNSIYGINAETIIGDMIVGGNIRILDKDGQGMFEVMDDKISSKISEYSNSKVSGDTRTVSEVLQDAHNLSVRISTLENTGVDSITTSTGYTFGADGLIINKSGEEITNLIDNTGMKVQRSGEDILVADNNGVEAINLSSRQYLIIGANSRFEDYNDGVDSNRTACFYIGE